MTIDQRVETWASKIAVFDYDAAVELTDGETDEAYTVHCLTPYARWFLLTVTSFYGEFASRWTGWPEGEADQTYSEAIQGLVNVMTCETEVTRIAVAAEAVLAQFVELNDRIGIGPADESINLRLDDIEARLAEISGKLPDTPLDPALIDQIEEILDGVGTVLGAAAILP